MRSPLPLSTTRAIILVIAYLGLPAHLLSPAPARAESDPRDTDPKTAEGWDPSERDALEKPLLAASARPPAPGPRAWREGRILFLRTDGSPLLRSFADVASGDLWEIYSYRGRLVDSPYHRIEVGSYEGGDFLLVDERSGLHLAVDADPVLSPDGRHFASASFDLEAGFVANRVSIWRVTDPSPSASAIPLPNLEWRLEPEHWGPREVKWIAPDRLRIVAAGRHPKAYAPPEERDAADAAEAAGIDPYRYIRTTFEVRLDPAKRTWRSDAEKFEKDHLPLERSELEPLDVSNSEEASP